MDSPFNFNIDFDAINRRHDEMRAEFLRLCAEPCMNPVSPGDRVVVAIGLLSKGYPWVREEGVALEVGGGSVRVRYAGRTKLDGTPDEDWVHPSLIVDVFPAAEEGEIDG